MTDEREIREAMPLSCGMITMIDNAIGTVLDALKRSGHYDDTVIIFNSDHGDCLGDYNLIMGAIQPDPSTDAADRGSEPVGHVSSLMG